MLGAMPEAHEPDAHEIDVRDNPDQSRFEARLDGQIAVSEYKLAGKTIIFTHTEVPKSLEGRGVGSALIRGALEHARDHAYGVAPICPFVAAYIRRHQEYQDLVLPTFRYMVK